MPYGTVKVDNITFTNGGVDTTITVSGLAASTTGDLTVTGTISGAVVRATTVSGVTVTGTTIQGASGTFTFITGGIATITSGVFALGSAAAPSISFSGDPNNGIYSPGADQVAISTNGAGRLFIDSSGRLLVGTSTAETWFGSLVQIQSSGSEASFTAIRNQNSASGSYIFLGKSRGTTANSATIVQSGDELGGINFLGADGSTNRGTAASIYAFVDGTPGTNDMPGRLVFSTTADGTNSPTERMRITNSGRVGIGQSSPATTFDLSGAYSTNVVSVAALNIDCSTGTYFTKTINGASTFTVSNVPASRSYAFTLEVNHTSGTITWFSGVEWPGGTAPTLTTGKTHLFMFVTDDGGSRWRAASLINYTT